MKATIKNLLRVQRADLANNPLIFLCGDNDAGKSSTMAAIRMAMTGSIERIALKKNVSELSHNGAKDYGVLLEGEGIQYAFGKAYGNKHAPEADRYILSLVTGGIKVTDLKADELQQLIIDLAGVSLAPAEVEKQLLKAGYDKSKVAIVLTHLAKSWDAAEKIAKEQTTEARTAWKLITGETYGKEKAESWEVVKPEIDDSAIAGLQAIVKDQEFEIAQLKIKKIESQSANKALQQKQAALATHKTTAETEIKARELLGLAEAELTKHDAEIARLEVLAAGKQKPKAYPCPCCQGSLMWEEGVLKEWEHEGAEPDLEAKATLARMIDSRGNRAAVVERHKRDVKAAQDSAVLVVNIEAEIAGLEIIDISAIEADLKQKEHDLANNNLALGVHAESLKLIESAGQRTVDAKKHHADVLEWLRIVDEVAPTGLRQKLVSAALDALHKQLDSFKAVVGNEVRITPDMSILINGHDSKLYSYDSSGRWRANTLLSLAIAVMSGAGICLVDAFDILHVNRRLPYLKLFLSLTKDKRVAQIIVGATLKEPPKLPPAFDVYWLENGIADLVAPTAKQVAA